jgi:hypothetical protein
MPPKLNPGPRSQVFGKVSFTPTILVSKNMNLGLTSERRVGKPTRQNSLVARQKAQVVPNILAHQSDIEKQ